MAFRPSEVIIVPLLESKPTRDAIGVAGRLADEQRARVLLLAPLFVELELPLDAHFGEEEAVLRAELDRRLAELRGAGVRAEGRIVRARHGQLGEGVAAAALEQGADLVVVGAKLEARPGFRRPFTRDVWSILHDAPCRVLLATGSARTADRAAA
jgi:nucleotide-binding universal stress UspA family protein